MKIFRFNTDKGVALIMALIVTTIIFMLIMSVLYVLTSSTIISGAGKRYATASEAADGAIEVIKESIDEVMDRDIDPTTKFPMSLVSGESITVMLGSGAVVPGRTSVIQLTLPGTELSAKYNSIITIEKLYVKGTHGTSIDFPPSRRAGGTTATYFRIDVKVEGPDNSKAETVALYRYM